MATVSQILRKSLTKELAPLLRQKGFVRRPNGKGFFRVRGGLVDSLTFVPSQWGGCFYMFFVENLLFSPYGHILSGWNVGERVRGGDAGEKERVDELDAVRFCDEMQKVLVERAFPWFEEMADLQRYLVRLREYNEPVYKLDEIALLAAIGEAESALALITERRKLILKEFEPEREIAQQMLAEYDRLERSIHSNKVCDQLRAWVKRNVQEEGLDMAVYEDYVCPGV